MDKDLYFSKMRETSERVFHLILKYLDRIKDVNSDLYEILMFLVNKRNHRPLLKPFLLRYSYEICGGKNWEQEIIPFCAVFELLNISSYQANSSFDNKLSIFTHDDKNSQFLASVITRELCLEILSESKDKHKNNVITVRDSLSKSNKFMYIAQHYDLNLLKISNLNKYLNDEPLYMKDYFNRCYYGTGIFNGQCTFIGGLLAGANNEQLEAIKNFGESYGIGLQIINDLADFVPPGTGEITEKVYKDQFSDLKNGKLTLGMYQILKIKKKETDWIFERIRNSDQFSNKDMVEISNIVVKENISDLVKSHSTDYANRAKEYLSIFPNSEAKYLLNLATSICNENKYLKCLNKLKA
ncbi:MAG: hypothetical protein GQ534_08570 [Candidatus Delongbacteria bacterium]|nr:hypothetical protein [Candidatus Delongbacteria bacterium]